MSKFNRYERIHTLMEEALKAKTSWGRNELMTTLDKVLLTAADEELAKGLPEQQPIPTAPDEAGVGMDEWFKEYP